MELALAAPVATGGTEFGAAGAGGNSAFLRCSAKASIRSAEERCHGGAASDFFLGAMAAGGRVPASLQS